MAAHVLSSCSSSVNHGCRKIDPSYPRSFLGDGHRILVQLTGKGNQNCLSYRKNKLSPKLTVYAVTKGSAESSKSEETVPSWAKPDSEEPPPWAQGEGKKDASPNGFEVPFFVYLLASAVTAIAAIGSIFEYVNQRPVFGVVNPDSIFYVPLLGFFAFTGIPTSAFLWFKSVQVANKEAEEQDRRDGYL
ncbi:Transmembrane protein [Trema orientale]|uniref:Transmembrane protein n=1 Tax=Trema orientale TaxID=63057 RepID=A0A2P5EIN4_TREOI|nr:Transmembrane protein [Trema orientale]